MPGNRQGGLKVKAKLLARDPDFYKKVGAIGGRNGNTGGFAYDRELAREAGAKGGAKSSRRALTDEQMAQLRDEYTGQWGQITQLASKYGCHVATIRRYLQKALAE